jgi:hypothetical protein
VVAASGGNHGVAVAFAAHKLRLPATIFVPSVASPEKMERIRGEVLLDEYRGFGLADPAPRDTKRLADS